MKKFLLAVFALISLNVVLISAGLQAGKTWDIPETYKTKKNPVKVSDDGLADGKELWNKECKICHGARGAGDGVKAKNLSDPCGDFTSKEFQSQLSDGGIFYLSFVKKISDHNFEKKIPDETDRWNIVNYIRTFKK